MFKFRIYKNLRIVSKNFTHKEKYIYILNDELKVVPNTEIKLCKDETKIKHISVSFKNNNKLIRKLSIYLHEYFLPKNYPESVKNDYTHFTKYSFLANVAFFIINFISTQVLINSLDMVGKNNAFFISAGLCWVIKEGLGQIGSILFTGKIGNFFDKNIKQWRYLGLLIGNAGLLMDTFAMIYPNHFLLIASIASLFKFSSFAASSTSRIGLFNHFSHKGDITDLMNKWNSQHNLAFFLGNLIGLICSLMIPSSFNYIFGFIMILSIFQLKWSYVSVFRYVNLNFFNLQRAYYQASYYIKENNIADISYINERERILFNLRYLKFSNYPLEKLIKKNDKQIRESIEIFEDSKFFVIVNKKYFSYKIYVYLKLDSDQIDIFLALIYSIRLNDMIKQKPNENINNILIENKKYIDSIDKRQLKKMLENKGWKIDFKKIECKYMRYQVV